MVARSREFWDMLEIARLRGLFLQGEKTIGQIAEEMGRSRNSVERKLSRLGLKRYENEHKQEYSDKFKAQVIGYYYETNGPETCEKFGINQRALEGILRRARRGQVVKIGERKNEWKVQEVVMVLRYLGLKPMPYIADKVGRSESSVASYIKRRGFMLHYVNGLKQDNFYKNFKTNESVPFIRNLEGDVFIPWTSMEENLQKIQADQIQIYVIKAMAKFQRYIQGCDNNRDVITVLWERMEE